MKLVGYLEGQGHAASNAIGLMLTAMSAFVIIGVVIYVITTLTGAFPTDAYTSLYTSLLTNTWSLVDIGMTLVVVIALFMLMLRSWFNPSVFLGIIDILTLFFLGYLNAVFLEGYQPFVAALGLTTYLPVFSSFVFGSTNVFIFAFFLVGSAILNFRKHQDSGSNNYGFAYDHHTGYEISHTNKEFNKYDQ